MKGDPVRAEEVERARTSLLNDFEKTQLETAAYVRALSEFAAIGDWRLFFLYRERLKKVTLAEALRLEEIAVYSKQATGEKYLIEPNR